MERAQLDKIIEKFDELFSFIFYREDRNVVTNVVTNVVLNENEKQILELLISISVFV